MPPSTLTNTPVPVFDPIADKDGMLTRPWQEYLQRLPLTLQLSIERINSIEGADQSAALAATDFSGGGLTEGLYRANYYCQLTQAASGTSSFQVTIAWTHEGTATSLVGTLINTNTLTSFDQNCILIHCDADSDITIAIAYATAGAPNSMEYHYHAALERVDV